MLPEINLGPAHMGVFPLCAGAGLMAIVLWVLTSMKRMGLDARLQERITECIPFCLLFGVVTGCASDVLLRIGVARALAEPAKIGMTFYGWMLGCCVALACYAKARRISVLFVLDLFLPSFALAQAIGRIGCFCGGCCFGCPASGWLPGVTYPEGSLPALRYGEVPLVPVQLIESAYLFLVFVVLVRLVKFKRRAATYFMLSGFGRFFLEFLRGDVRGEVWRLSFLSPAQLVGLALISAGLVMFGRKDMQDFDII